MMNQQFTFIVLVVENYRHEDGEVTDFAEQRRLLASRLKRAVRELMSVMITLCWRGSANRVHVLQV
jgi:hypothetical protein